MEPFVTDYMNPKRPRLLPAYLLSAFIVLVAAFASLPLVETAAVRVAAPPQRLETNVLINVPARHVDAEIRDSQLATTSMTKSPAQFASGQVTFTYRCLPTPVCKPASYAGVPQGVVVATANNVRYATQAEARFGGPGETANAPIKAIAPGAAANTGFHTITTMEGYPVPSQITVDNQDPVTGGADPTVTQVIQQFDIDVVQRDLTSRIADKLDAALMGQVPGMDFLVDGPPSFDVHTDHVVGDAAPTFTMTITGKVGAVAFLESSAQALVRSALQPFVQPGYKLTSEPIQTSYQITQVITNGSATVRVAAITVALPTLSAQRLSTRLKGRTLLDAHNELQSEFPGSQVDISLKPFALPCLPLIADHIRPTLVVEPANGIYREYTMTGTVPDGITTALIQIDLDDWAGGKGPIDVDLYQVSYFQGGDPSQRVPNGDFAEGTTNWGIAPAATGVVSLRPSDRGGQLLHMKAARPIPQAYVNSLGFPVTAGTTYKVTFAARVSPASRASGQFVLIWSPSEQFQEQSRRTIAFAPAW